MKNLKNLGNVLTKVEQQTIQGGRMQCDKDKDGACETYSHMCAESYCCYDPGDY